MKKYLIRRADTENFHFISMNDSISVFKDFNDWLINNGYIMLHNANHGPWGCFGCTIEKDNNNQSITMYALEIFSFKKETFTKKDKQSRLNKIESILLKYKLSDSGSIVFKDYDKYPNYYWHEIETMIESNLINGFNGQKIQYLTSNNFLDAKNEAQQKLFL